MRTKLSIYSILLSLLVSGYCYASLTTTSSRPTSVAVNYAQTEKATDATDILINSSISSQNSGFADKDVSFNWNNNTP